MGCSCFVIFLIFGELLKIVIVLFVGLMEKWIILLWFLWDNRDVCLIVVESVGVEILIVVLDFLGISCDVLG